jgi:hypothetical protein
LAGVGCAGGASGGGELGKPIAQFPSRSDLESVARTPSPVTKQVEGLADAESWQTETPPVAQAKYPEETVWDKLLIEAARGHGNPLVLAPELRCAAQEAARFYTVHGGMPDDGLREHLLLRCGSSLDSHGFSYLVNPVPDNVPAAQLEAAARMPLLKHLDERMKGQSGQMALGVARGHGRFAAVVLTGLPRVALRGFSPVITGSSVTLEGELKGPAEYLVGFVNQGRYGVAYCEGDSRLQLPAFRIRCPVAAEDQSARIELSTKQAGRVLFNAVAQVEVRREGSNPEYNAAAYGANETVANSAQFRTLLLADLNKVRLAAKLPPFVLETQQSITDERLAPHLYQSSRDGDERQLSTIALGLLAGWDVKGMIRNGGVFFRTINATRNPSRWLTQALDSPLGRWVLLEPAMSRIGIGATDLQPSGAMAIVTTYAFFDHVDHRADEETVLAELDRLRKAHGAAPLRRVVGDPALARALEQIGASNLSSAAALNVVLQQAAESMGRSVQGYVVETTDVKQMQWDPTLVESSTLDVEVGVTHYRAPGAAWGQYVVLFVVVNHGNPVREAKHQTRRHHL